MLRKTKIFTFGCKMGWRDLSPTKVQTRCFCAKQKDTRTGFVAGTHGVSNGHKLLCSHMEFLNLMLDNKLYRR